MLAARVAGLLLALSIGGLAWAADLTVQVTQLNGRPLPGAVVTVHALAAATPPPAPIQAVMDQIDLAFVPDLLVIPVGSTVSFPNTDKVSHEVYSFSADASFQTRPVSRAARIRRNYFDHPGLVTLGCNIHDAMLAYILVTDARLLRRDPRRWQLDGAGYRARQVSHRGVEPAAAGARADADDARSS